MSVQTNEIATKGDIAELKSLLDVLVNEVQSLKGDKEGDIHFAAEVTGLKVSYIYTLNQGCDPTRCEIPVRKRLNRPWYKESELVAWMEDRGGFMEAWRKERLVEAQLRVV